MNRLLAINSVDDIPAPYRGTPIGLLLEYNNLDRPFEEYTNAQLLVGMCMDNRKHLHMPDNFSYIIRTGGANLRYSEFKVSYAISVGGVRHIALIGLRRKAPRSVQSGRRCIVIAFGKVEDPL